MPVLSGIQGKKGFYSRFILWHEQSCYDWILFSEISMLMPSFPPSSLSDCTGAFQVILIKWGHQSGAHGTGVVIMRKRHHNSLSPCEDTESKWLHVSQEESHSTAWSRWHPDIRLLASGAVGKLTYTVQGKPNQTYSSVREPEPYCSLASLW